MAKMMTFGGNVETETRTCECVLCGAVQSFDVCNTCHLSEPDGSLDLDTLDEMIAAELKEMRRS